MPDSAVLTGDSAPAEAADNFIAGQSFLRDGKAAEGDVQSVKELAERLNINFAEELEQPPRRHRNGDPIDTDALAEEAPQQAKVDGPENVALDEEVPLNDAVKEVLSDMAANEAADSAVLSDSAAKEEAHSAAKEEAHSAAKEEADSAAKEEADPIAEEKADSAGKEVLSDMAASEEPDSAVKEVLSDKAVNEEARNEPGAVKEVLSDEAVNELLDSAVKEVLSDNAVNEEAPNEPGSAVKEVLSDEAANEEADSAVLSDKAVLLSDKAANEEADSAAKEVLSDMAANEEPDSAVKEVLSDKAVNEEARNEPGAVKEVLSDEAANEETDSAVLSYKAVNEEVLLSDKAANEEADSAAKEALFGKAVNEEARNEEAPTEPDAAVKESETGVKNAVSVHDDRDGGKPDALGVEGPPLDLVRQIVDQHEDEVVSHVDANTAVQQADERREELPVVQSGKDSNLRQDLFFPDTPHSQTFFTPELNNFQDVNDIKGGFEGAYLAPAQAQPWEVKEESPGNLRAESGGSPMVAIAGLSLVGVFGVFALRKCLVKRPDLDSIAPLADHKSA